MNIKLDIRGRYIPPHTVQEIEAFKQRHPHVLINLAVLWWYCKLRDHQVTEWQQDLPKALELLETHIYKSRSLTFGGLVRLGDWMLRNTAWRVEIPTRMIKLGKRLDRNREIMKTGTRYVYNQSMPKIEIDNHHRVPLLYDPDYYGTEINWYGTRVARNMFRVMLPSEVLELTGWKVNSDLEILVKG